MSWSRLRTFLTVADCESVRVAAQRLSVTESAVSAAVASLQREVGAALIERNGRGTRLTEAGQVYAGYARQVLGLLEEGAAAARDGERPDHGLLRLGAVTTAGEYLVPGLLAGFRARYPQVEVTLEVTVRDRVHALLLEHQLDLVIAGRPPRGSQLVTRARRPNALVVVASPVLAGEPGSLTWLLREPGSGTRETTLALLESHDLRPPLLALGSHGAVVAGAARGLGLALVSRDAVGRELAAGELVVVPVRGTPLVRPWHAVTSRTPTATTRLFVDYLVDRSAGDLAFTRPVSRPTAR